MHAKFTVGRWLGGSIVVAELCWAQPSLHSVQTHTAVAAAQGEGGKGRAQKGLGHAS